MHRPEQPQVVRLACTRQLLLQCRCKLLLHVYCGSGSGRMLNERGISQTTTAHICWDVAWCSWTCTSDLCVHVDFCALLGQDVGEGHSLFNVVAVSGMRGRAATPSYPLTTLLVYPRCDIQCSVTYWFFCQTGGFYGDVDIIVEIVWYKRQKH